MSKFILTDIDDTIIRFGGSLQKWMEAKGHAFTGGNLIDVYSLAVGMNCDPDLATDHIIDFCTVSNNMATLPAQDDSKAVLPVLKDMGYEFVAISSCVNTPEVMEQRAHNLETEFGFKWYAVHGVGLNLSKDDVLKQYPPSWWIEDNAAHAIAGDLIGHKSLLMDRKYNRGLEAGGVQRVRDWHHVLELISSESYEKVARIG